MIQNVLIISEKIYESKSKLLFTNNRLSINTIDFWIPSLFLEPILYPTIYLVRNKYRVQYYYKLISMTVLLVQQCMLTYGTIDEVEN